MTKELDDIQNRMTTLTAFITDSIEQVNNDDMVDLQGMDDEVGALCEQSVALPPEQAAQIQPLMAEMISKLELLGQALQAFQERKKS